MRSRGSIFDEVVLYVEYGDTCGSGVLIPTLNQKWLCVLTAHHVLEYAKELRFEKLNVKRLRKNQFEDVDLIWKQYFFDKEMDIAVLMAEYQKAYDLPVATIHEDDLMYMCGFPGILHDNERVKRFTLEGKVKEVSQEDLITSINDRLGTYESSEIDSLKCFSGSGIFAPFGDGLVLAGIETEALTKDAAFHSVRNAPINYIEKMIYNHMQDTFGLKTEVFEHRDIAMQIKKSKAYPGILRPVIDVRLKSQSIDELKKQYLAGINAHPDHIRSNLDIRRPYWLEQIETQISQNNIVIIKGASGQGKSTLVYRFLLDHYSEDQIVTVKRIVSENDIETAIMSLCRIQSDGEIALFYDVQPGDTKWAYLIEEFENCGKELQGKLFLAVRNEDYNRTHFDKSRFMVKEIDLQLSEREAMELYQRYRSSKYLSFADSWSKFGEHGPLMEYIFMLNHSETLVERIRGQIKRIEDSDDSDEWIGILEVIALAGKYNQRLKIERLFNNLPCRNKKKLLQRFQEELFIKVSSEGKYIECLHMVRAEILFSVLRDEIGFDYEKVLLKTLAVVEDSPLYMLINYYRDNSCSEELIKSIAMIDVANIVVIQGILKSLLWYEIFEYQNINQSVIEEGDKLLNNQFILLVARDITGYLVGDEKQQPFNDVFQLFEKYRPGIKRRTEEIYRKMPRKQLTYEYVDLYLLSVKSTIEKYLCDNWNDISAIGYVLFWAAYRRQIITLDYLPEINYSKMFSSAECLNLMKGLNSQRYSNEICQLYKDKVLWTILDNCNVAFYWSEDNEIFAQIICDPCAEETLHFNEICMQAVWALRIFEPDMVRYNVRILGAEIEGIYVPDTHKNISSESLYEKWFVEINKINRNLHDYNAAPDDWKCVCNHSIKKRAAIVDELKKYLKLIDRWYRKGRLEVSDLIMLLKQRGEGNPFIVPKCARDKYGFANEKLDTMIINGERTAIDEEEKVEFEKGNSIEKLSRRYFYGIDNFFNAISRLLLSEKEDQEDELKQRRLAFFNITDAYDALLRYQMIFEQFFKDYIYDEIDLTTEISVVLKTVSITRKMYQNQYRIENNVVYGSTEEVKKEFRKIDIFLESGITQIQGVQNVENQGDTIIVKVLVEYIDIFLIQLFSSVKTLIGKKGEISIGEIYLKNRLRFFDVRYILNDITIMESKISIRNIAISEDIAKFKLYCGYENTIVKNGEGSVREKAFILLLNARNGLEAINEQVYKINKALEHTKTVNSNEVTLDRIDKSYQVLIEEIRLELLKVLTLFEESDLEKRQFTEPIKEVVDLLPFYKKFILRSLTDAQLLYVGMRNCLEKINRVLAQ